MSYTHVVIKMKAKGKDKAVFHVESDLDEYFVLENIVKPYVKSTTVFVDGSRINPNDVEKLSVFSSEREGKLLLADASARMSATSARAAANGIFMGGGVATMRHAVQGEGTEDITRKIFNQAQGL